MKFIILHMIFVSYLSGNRELTTYPFVEITNGLINAGLYLPDKENGFYRSTRFDMKHIIQKGTMRFTDLRKTVINKYSL